MNTFTTRSAGKHVRGSPSSVLHTPSEAHVPPCHAVLNSSCPKENENDDSSSTANDAAAAACPSSSWKCPASLKSLRTMNPIRAIVDPIVEAAAAASSDNNNDKSHISLALGDPTVSGHLETCPVVVRAVMDVLQHDTAPAAGYVNALGTLEARTAIAKHHGRQRPRADAPPVDSDDVDATNEASKNENDDAASSQHVIVANGCSGALELALTALLDPGTVLLVPRPGFPLYQVICTSHGASVAQYNLLPNQQWECDLEHIEQLVTQHYAPGVVRGIVITNPSNPTGSVYSRQHLEELVLLAQRLQLPIVSDEVYGDLTYGNAKFHPLANVAADLGSHVPIITASGLAKQYLLPGWRVGWLVFQDSHNGAIREVEAGAKRLAQVILGASHLAQSVVPALLDPKSASDRHAIAEWKAQLKSTLECQANALCDELANCIGLFVHMPQGAMYAMVEIDLPRFADSGIHNDLDFVKRLLEEENVFVLPGRAFGIQQQDSAADDDESLPSSSHNQLQQQQQHASSSAVSSPDLVCFRIVFCASADTLREAAHRICNFCHRHSCP